MSFAAMAKGIPPSMHAAAGSGILIPLRASFFFLPRTLYLLLKDSQALCLHAHAVCCLHPLAPSPEAWCDQTATP